MIRYLKNHQVNKQKWDHCIARSFNGIIYAYSWYLDIVNPGWEALVEEDYVAVMPLTRGKKWGVSYLFQPFFVQQLGVFSVGKLSEQKVDEFLQSIPRKYGFVEINLNTFNKANNPGYAIKANLNHELDLIDSYEHLARHYSQNHQRNIKKSRQQGLKISHQANIQDVIGLFRNNRGKYLETFKNKDYGTLEKLIEHCSSRGIGHTIGVFTEKNILCAGAFFIESNNKVIFLFSGANDEAKEKGAMFFLIDCFIRENSQRNLTLDFEGSNNENLARFYKGFGSKECVYLQVRKNNLPFFMKWLKK